MAIDDIAVARRRDRWAIRPIVRRGIKFGLTGLAGAAIAYLLFIACLSVVGYQGATVLSWAGSMWFGFLVNRRFTFGVRGARGWGRQALAYAVGAGLQLGLALAGYAILIGELRWPGTPAFLVVTATVALFGFAYQSAATFRSAASTSSATDSLAAS
ncbi:MAG TPA: GtrA family protein [Caulobacteraceae bacterium]|jgi:putative flippase GtrA